MPWVQASLLIVLFAGCTGTGAPPDSGSERADGAESDTPRAGCETPDGDGDGAAAIACGGADCDDGDPARGPMRTEICDEADVDEDCNPDTFGFRDRDGDGAADVQCCNASAGTGPICGTDCDDVRRGVSPDSPEVCNGADDDCDGLIDEGVVQTYFRDADVDGHGAAGDSSDQCAPTGEYTATNDDDCDDADPLVHPGAAERCNAIDDDCSSGGGADPAEDVDGDGHTDATFTACETGFPRDDCDDGDVRVHPGAEYQRVPRCLGVGAPCTQSDGTWWCGVPDATSTECAAFAPKGVIVSWDYDCAGPATGTPEPSDPDFCPPLCAFGVTCRGPTEFRPRYSGSPPPCGTVVAHAACNGDCTACADVAPPAPMLLGCR